MIVDVCGIPFEVKEIESNSRMDVSMGRSDSKMAIITINKEMPKEMKESVLIHEWKNPITKNLFVLYRMNFIDRVSD